MYKIVMILMLVVDWEKVGYSLLFDISQRNKLNKTEFIFGKKNQVTYSLIELSHGINLFMQKGYRKSP